MAEGKDKFDINNDQKLKQDNLDKSDGPIAKTEILDGQPEHGNQSHVSEEPTADGVIFPGNDDYDYPVHENQSTESFTDISGKSEMHEGYDHEQYNKLDRDQLETISEPTADGVIFPGNDEIHDTEERADADFRPGNENFDINNDQKIAFDKSDGPGPDGAMEIVHLEDDAIQVSGDVAGGDAENYNAGTNWVKTDTPIHDTEERADADIIPGDHIAKTELLDGQPEHGILGQANGAPNVSGDVVNMADMHSHMDDAAAHQVPEGPPQDPQGMGLDRLGTQFDEDGMGDMHKPDDPNDGGEVV